MASSLPTPASPDVASHELLLMCRQLNPAPAQVLLLNVSGKLFQVSRAVLTRYPLSVFATLFSEAYQLQLNERGEAFLDMNPIMFEHILRWLRNDTPPRDLNEQDKDELIALCKRWRLDDIAQSLERESLRKRLQAISASKSARDLRICANMDGLDLSGLDLEGGSFDGSSLRGTNLANANLKYASFRGADLREANLAFADL